MSSDLILFVKNQNTSAFIYESHNDFENTIGKVKEISSVGDKEGGGEYSEKVFYFEKHNVYLKVTGFYSSYNGTDWNNDWTEVFPKEKLITVYEPM